VNIIHLATEDGRNARVPLLRPRRLTPATVKVTATGEEVTTKAVHRGNRHLDPASIDPQSLIDADPEIDLDNVGRILTDTTRAYRRPGSHALEGNFQVIVTTYAADGTVKERKPYVPREANINDVSPVRLGKHIPLVELFQRFVFHNQLYIAHHDGLQHEFLFEVARSLEAAEAAETLGAGPRGNLPLVLQHGGAPTRAFLIGSTEGERYSLRVLLTRQELKVPAAAAAVSAPD